MTSMRSSSTISWKLREYRKSPTSTLAALPHTALAVLRPRRRSRFVDDVVVQQGGGMDEFDHRGELVRIRAAMSERARRKQQQHRPQALAAGADDVFGDLVDQHHVGGEATRISASTAAMSSWASAWIVARSGSDGVAGRREESADMPGIIRAGLAALGLVP